MHPFSRHSRPALLVLAVVMLAALPLLLGACGGGDDDSSDSDAPDVPESSSETPGAGPPPGYRRGTSDNGVDFASSPGGLVMTFNDEASDELKGRVQGEEFEAVCKLESGDEDSASGEWPAEIGTATVLIEGDSPVDSCSLRVGGDEVAEVDLEPIDGS